MGDLTVTIEVILTIAIVKYHCDTIPICGNLCFTQFQNICCYTEYLCALILTMDKALGTSFYQTNMVAVIFISHAPWFHSK